MRKFIAYIIFITLLISTLVVFVRNGLDIFQFYFELIKLNGLIILLSMALYFVLFKNKIGFIENFLHEFTHFLFAVLFFEKIKQLYISETNGEIVIGSEKENLIIGLSPYFFPILPISFILIFNNNSFIWANIVVLSLYGFYLAQTINQLLKHNIEIFDFSWYGIVFIVVLKFWISLYILSWSSGTTQTLYNSILNF